LVELTYVRNKWRVPRSALRWESKTAFAYYHFVFFDLGKCGERKSIKYRFMGKTHLSHTQIFDYITTPKRILFRSSGLNYTVKKFFRILLTARCYHLIQKKKPWHFFLSYERWIQSVLSCNHSVKFTVNAIIQRNSISC